MKNIAKRTYAALCLAGMGIAALAGAYVVTRLLYWAFVFIKGLVELI